MPQPVIFPTELLEASWSSRLGPEDLQSIGISATFSPSPLVHRNVTAIALLSSHFFSTIELQQGGSPVTRHESENFDKGLSFYNGGFWKNLQNSGVWERMRTV